MSTSGVQSVIWRKTHLRGGEIAARTPRPSSTNPWTGSSPCRASHPLGLPKHRCGYPHRSVNPGAHKAGAKPCQTTSELSCRADRTAPSHASGSLAGACVSGVRASAARIHSAPTHGTARSPETFKITNLSNTALLAAATTAPDSPDGAEAQPAHSRFGNYPSIRLMPRIHPMHYFPLYLSPWRRLRTRVIETQHTLTFPRGHLTLSVRLTSHRAVPLIWYTHLCNCPHLSGTQLYYRPITSQ